MKVYTKVVIDIATGQIIERECYDYEGPVALCDGGGDGGDDDGGFADVGEVAEFGGFSSAEATEADIAEFSDVADFGGAGGDFGFAPVGELEAPAPPGTGLAPGEDVDFAQASEEAAFAAARAGAARGGRTGFSIAGGPGAVVGAAIGAGLATMGMSVPGMPGDVGPGFGGEEAGRPRERTGRPARGLTEVRPTEEEPITTGRTGQAGERRRVGRRQTLLTGPLGLRGGAGGVRRRVLLGA